MNIGNIVEPNSKGQIVIPKKIRDELNINEDTSLNIVVREDGIYIHPVKEVITYKEAKASRRILLELLKETRGMWVGDKDFNQRQKQREKLEIAAAKRMKKAW